MRPHNTLGSDDFHAIFYQRHWEVVGNSVTHLCFGVLNGGQSVADLNKIHVTLISKVKIPRRVMDHRPISLCNVIFNIITKDIANRLKRVMDGIISCSQSAFVPGRLISSNVIIAYELMHSMKNKSNGDKGLLGLKVDMSKAYHRVKWIFLDAMMDK